MSIPLNPIWGSQNFVVNCMSHILYSLNYVYASVTQRTVDLYAKEFIATNTNGPYMHAIIVIQSSMMFSSGTQWHLSGFLNDRRSLAGCTGILGKGCLHLLRTDRRFAQGWLHTHAHTQTHVTSFSSHQSALSRPCFPRC